MKPFQSNRFRLALLGFSLLLIFSCLIVWSLLLSPSQIGLEISQPFAAKQGRIATIAHRGGAGLWPENTMHAFQQASLLGVDALELDVQRTAGGEMVIIHDHSVDRTTNGSGEVNGFTLAELQALDAGYNWTADGGKSYPYRGQGLTIPTLAELFNQLPHMPMVIEMKESEPALAEALCQAIQDFDMGDRVLVASSHGQAVQEFRQLCPGIATSASQPEVIWYVLGRIAFPGRALRWLPAQAMSIPDRIPLPWSNNTLQLVTPGLVETLHSRQLPVNVWTINQPEDMRSLIDIGVDGIVTDYPDRLLGLAE